MSRPQRHLRRKLLAGAVFSSVVLLESAIGVSAATSAAQIVNCAATTWCFSPNPITVPAGSTVSWTNATAATHTATSDTGTWTTGNIAAGATSGALTFNTPGTYSYHCAIHPFMTGTLVVAAATTSPRPTASPSPTVKRLAPGGAGPALPVAAVLLLFGLGLLRPWRARPRLHRGR